MYPRFYYLYPSLKPLGSSVRPKSVRNRCVIEVFGGVCVCCPLVFEFSVGIGGFVIGLGQISFFFSNIPNTHANHQFYTYNLNF